MRVIKTNPTEQNATRISLPLTEPEYRRSPAIAATKDRKVALPTMDGIHFERIQHITSLEAQGNYTLLNFTDGRQLLVCRTLQDMEGLLGSPYQFVRIHRSFTINLNQLQRYVRGKGGYVIMENGKNVNVSVGKKQSFLEAVDFYFSGE